MVAEVNADRSKEASRAAVLWSAPLRLMAGVFGRPRIFERSKKPIRMGGIVAMPQRSIAREIEELFPGQF